MPVSDDSLLGSVFTAHQPSENQICFPKSWNSFMKDRMIITTNKKCSPVEILECYCLTPESKSSDVDTGSLQNMHFGKCFYGCFSKATNIHYQVQLVDQLDKGKCAQFECKGILCGQCKDGYGPASATTTRMNELVDSS